MFKDCFTCHGENQRKNTIEMIKALTELEVIQVGVNKRPLSNKGNSLKSNRGTFAQIYRIS